MSDISAQRAPTRGRGLSRGGRGGGAVGRGGRNGAGFRSNGDSHDDVPLEDQGELGKLKQKYASQLTILKEMFPSWTDEDLINPLEESFGDAQMAASLISEGHATQWSDVKKKTKEKPKHKGPSGTMTDEGSRPGRGGLKSARGTFEGGRGGRGGRGTDRGNLRGGRGGLAPRGGKTTNGADATGAESSDSPAGTQDAGDDKPADDSTDPKESEGGAGEVPTWKSIAAGDATTSLVEKARAVTPAAPMTASEKPAAKSAVPVEPPKKTWASLLHAPPAPPPQPQPQQQPQPQPATAAPKKPQSPVLPKVEAPAPVPVPEPIVESTTSLPPPQETPVSLPPPVTTPIIKKSPIIAPALPEIATPKLPQTELAAPITPEAIKVTEDPVEPEPVTEEPPEEIPESLPSPGLDKLTEENLEKIENVAPAPPTSTAASTVATTPLPIAPLSQKGLPPAHRAPGHRSGLRRMLDQHEAVVMPRGDFVDRAAVQFGSMGLNGDLDDSEEVEQPEKPETVAPPQQSPISQPKASLPTPVATVSTPSNITTLAQQPIAIPQPQQIQEQQQPQHQQPVSVPRHAPGLAAPIQQPSHANALSSSPGAPQQIQQQQPPQPLGQSLPRQSGFGADTSKFDTYGQQPHLTGQQNPVAQSPYGGYQTQQPSQPAADPYANYYSSGDPARSSAFNTFYNTPYQSAQGQQQSHQPTDQAAQQPRSTSALGGGVGASLESTPSGAAVSGSQPQNQQSRFGASFQGNEASQPGQAGAQQAGPQQQHPSQYPMHPSYYPYYNYMQQMYGHYGSYPKGFYGGSPQAYMSPGGYEHSSSPGNYAGFAGPGSQGRESAVTEYGRTGASQGHTQQQQQPQQPQQQTQHPGLGYGTGGMPDYMSSRQHAQLGGFGTQQQQHGLGGSQQGGHADDTLKPYGEAKVPTGPSANPTGAPGRPPSTSGLSGPAGQSQIPQGQSQQHQQNLMGGYPQHLQGQSGGNTPLMGGNQGTIHHNSQYGMYGGFGSGGYPQYGSQGGNRQQGGWGYGGH